MIDRIFVVTFSHRSPPCCSTKSAPKALLVLKVNGVCFGAEPIHFVESLDGDGAAASVSLDARAEDVPSEHRVGHLPAGVEQNAPQRCGRDLDFKT